MLGMSTLYSIHIISRDHPLLNALFVKLMMIEEITITLFINIISSSKQKHFLSSHSCLFFEKKMNIFFH